MNNVNVFFVQEYHVKLSCNCGCELVTNDLYPTKDWECYHDSGPNVDNEEYYWRDRRYQVKKGSCIIERKDFWGDRVIRVNPNDTLKDWIPPFKQGWGCCDYHGLELKCPKCNTTVATADLDCWMDRNVKFFEKNVTRVY